jgi:hypothetical protein
MDGVVELGCARMVDRGWRETRWRSVSIPDPPSTSVRRSGGWPALRTRSRSGPPGVIAIATTLSRRDAADPERLWKSNRVSKRVVRVNENLTLRPGVHGRERLLPYDMKFARLQAVVRTIVGRVRSWVRFLQRGTLIAHAHHRLVSARSARRGASCLASSAVLSTMTLRQLAEQCLVDVFYIGDS